MCYQVNEQCKQYSVKILLFLKYKLLAHENNFKLKFHANFKIISKLMQICAYLVHDNILFWNEFYSWIKWKYIHASCNF